MDHDYLLKLRQHPTWRLLCADNALRNWEEPTFVSFPNSSLGMRQSEMNNDLIIKINKFIELEYYQQAINLLQKHLETNPSDLSALFLLVRIYKLLGHSHQLKNQSKQAIEYFEYSVKYLKESVKRLQFITDLKKSRKDSPLTDNFYDVDDFTEDDYKYIDEKSNDVDEIYLHDSEEHNFSILEPNIVSDDYVDSIYDDLKVDLEIICIANDLNNRETEKIGEYDADDLEITYTDNDLSSEEIEINDVDFESIDSIESDNIFEFYEEDTDKIFSWDDLDNFDEIDEYNEFNKNEIAKTGKINRHERAMQIAVEVIQKYDWGEENLYLLQQVFYENGWIMARKSIERELSKGLMPDELELAMYIRELWTENEQYWISFLHIKSNISGQSARAAYKNMSWSESLRIIRSFSYSPSKEEVQYFIEEIYDDWYCSTRLQKSFKIFIRYLKYRTGSVRGTLLGNEVFSFIYSHDDIINNENNENMSITSMVTELERKYSFY